MFRKAKQIDTAFKNLRLYSFVVIGACTLITLYTIYKSFSLEENRKVRVLVLPAGKVVEAVSENRKVNLPVEARDHVRTFHEYFFSLSPDDEVIEKNVRKALYLADRSAKAQYDNLKERNYYSQLISGNVSQEIEVDSVRVNMDRYPYYFKCYATQKIIRATTIATRSLLTEGYLRNVQSSDHNPHGFLIEQWKVIENKDIQVKAR